jgi:hypothetical protein
VITGFRAGAKLGRIVVKRGYAVTGRLPRRSLDGRRTAAAKSGRPIGAAKLGEVKTPATGRPGPGLDPDRDGIPGSFDADDDGDMRLDNVDRSPARAACCFIDLTDVRHAMWLMNIGLEQSFLAARTGLAPGAGGYALNTHSTGQFAASDAFKALVDTAMKLRGSLLFPLPSAAAELDCTGLPYCTAFGKSTDMTQMKRFPADFDTDGDGFGSMLPVGAFNPANDGIGTVQLLDPAKVFGMKPAATRTEIQSGQTMLERVNGDYPVMLNMVFQTVPALVRWADESGQSELAQNAVSYPLTDQSPGAQANPIALRPSKNDGDYWLKLQLWRPQRYDGNAYGDWVDMGFLQYAVVGRTIGAGSQLWHCPSSAYRTSPADDEVAGLNALHEQYLTQNGIFDESFDAVRTNVWTLTFWVNLSACQRASGVPVWSDGDQTASEVSVAAMSDYGDAAEGVGFAFKPAPPAGSGGGGGGGAPTAPATGTWGFQGGAPSDQVGWNVRMNHDGIAKFRIQFHEATPVKGLLSQPPDWTCSTVTVSNPNDALECTTPAGVPAGTSVSQTARLTNAGSNGMPVTLTVTENGAETSSDITQTQ